MVSTFWFKNFCDRFLRGRVGLDGFDRLIIMLEVCLLLQSIMGFSLIDFFGLWDFLSFAGTRFRPLSLNIPKPLFPLAGQAMVHHPMSACKRVHNIFEDLEFDNFWCLLIPYR